MKRKAIRMINQLFVVTFSYCAFLYMTLDSCFIKLKSYFQYIKIFSDHITNIYTIKTYTQYLMNQFGNTKCMRHAVFYNFLI